MAIPSSASKQNIMYEGVVNSSSEPINCETGKNASRPRRLFSDSADLLRPPPLATTAVVTGVAARGVDAGEDDKDEDRPPVLPLEPPPPP